jgi:hypothetical protein
VDAVTQTPISGATVTLREVNSLTYFQPQPIERQVGTTDANGSVTVSGIHKKDVLVLSKPRYEAVTVGFVEGGKVAIAPYLLTAGTNGIGKRLLVEGRGTVTVPLCPKPPPTEGYRTGVLPYK